MDIKHEIEGMTLEEKAGQLLMEDFVGRYSVPDDMQEALSRGHVGSVLFFSGCNIVDSYQLKGLISNIMDISAGSRHKIAPFLAVDQEGGQLVPITRNVSIGPGNMALAAIKDNPEKYSYEMGRVTAEELKTIGINVNFAPVVDISHEDGLPVKDNRYFGSNPEEVGRLGASFIRGTQTSGVMACAKHFPGQRNVELDSHYELDVVPYDIDRLMSKELVPFIHAIDAGVEMIMTLHAAYPKLDPENVPATLSRPILNGILRQKLGYKGLIVSDDIQMDPVIKVYGLDGAIIKAVNAGVDQIIISRNQREAYKVIVDAVKAKVITEDCLNESVERILTAKARYTHSEMDSDAETKRILTVPENAKMILEAAEKSCTVVSNKNALIPLKLNKRSRVAVIRPAFGRLVMSDNSNFFTHTFTDSFKDLFPDFSEYVTGMNPTSSEILGAQDWAFMSDITIFCTYNAYQYKAQFEMLKAVRQLTDDAKIILVCLRSPEDIKLYPEEIGSIVATYGVTKVSIEALGSILAGKIKYEGVLPLSLGSKYPKGTKAE